MMARRLPPIALRMVASPGYLLRRGTPRELSDLADHDLVTREVASRWDFESGGVQGIVEPSGRIVIPDAGAQKVVIEGGAGIGCLPVYLADPAISSGSLVPVLPAWKRPLIEIHAVYPSHKSMSAKVRVFIDALITHLQPKMPRHLRAGRIRAAIYQPAPSTSDLDHQTKSLGLPGDHFPVPSSRHIHRAAQAQHQRPSTEDCQRA
jgi:hypothetical protein